MNKEHVYLYFIFSSHHVDQARFQFTTGLEATQIACVQFLCTEFFIGWQVNLILPLLRQRGFSFTGGFSQHTRNFWSFIRCDSYGDFFFFPLKRRNFVGCLQRTCRVNILLWVNILCLVFSASLSIHSFGDCWFILSSRFITISQLAFIFINLGFRIFWMEVFRLRNISARG